MNTNPLSHGYRLRAAGLASLTAAALLLCPAPSHAQPANDDQSGPGAAYRKGKTAYDVGNFEEAIAHFKQAYAMQPHEAYLYNIAQAYRQSGDCRNALFFFKRYVTVGGEQARHYELAQRRIEELTQRCESAGGMKNEPPRDEHAPERTGNAGGAENGASTARPADDAAAGATVRDAPREESGAHDSIRAASPASPRARAPVLAASLELGGAALDIGALEIAGRHLSLAMGAGYPLRFGRLGVTLGGLFTYTPLSWENDRTNRTGTSSLAGAIANLGVRYAVRDRLALRFEAGAGALFLTGASRGSVFLAEDMRSTSALGMFHLRIGIGAEYPIAGGLVLSASPLVFSYSPAREGMEASVDRFVRVDFIAGVGYRR